MPTYRDFLVALDDHIDLPGSLGYVQQGFELYGIAERAGLTQPGDRSAFRWTGELVEYGYVIHSRPGGGDRKPVPPGTLWSEHELQRFGDYRVTALGREEADRIRRQRREALTDAAMGVALPQFLRPWMTDGQRRAVSEPLAELRAALDADRRRAAIGAAKDLAEAACKVAIEHAGQPVPPAASLTALFKVAATAGAGAGATPGAADTEADLGHRLAAVVHRLDELRNVAGAGHGRAAQPETSAREARVAATAACGVALFVLSDEN
jgi:hypothetical protein